MENTILLPLPKGLLRENICGYSEDEALLKNEFHKAGKRFLRALAQALGLDKTHYDLRSNLGGVAVSGEVTLHTDKLYVQLSESALRPGVSILFRSCNGRKDYSGGTNRWAWIPDLKEAHGQNQFLTLCQKIQEGSLK